ncbi:DUF7097 family protein [Salinarchaeum laminariae]|uniref:DUF7097 family protein n=1 Tax=Salinarchaeum laminariae TaxID=869888 RepID=UPI0020BFDECC|nr:hypothetical protein [Salinarchaeum laminariae]
MEETPTGTPVGVDDPYDHVDRCNHCTDEGTCRFAFDRFTADPTFAEERRDDEYRCPVVNPDADREWDASECPNFTSTTDGKECRRCGIEERRMAHSSDRPLIEEHHLSYAGNEARSASEQSSIAERSSADHSSGQRPREDGDGGEPRDGKAPDGEDDPTDGDHEITVALCRWCHTKVHKSWARIDDDVSPDPEAIAAREQRRGREFDEASFDTAAERFGED